MKISRAIWTLFGVVAITITGVPASADPVNDTSDIVMYGTDLQGKKAPSGVAIGTDRLDRELTKFTISTRLTTSHSLRRPYATRLRSRKLAVVQYGSTIKKSELCIARRLFWDFQKVTAN